MAQREIVKKVANAVLFSDGCIRIDNVRLSYPHVYVAKAGTDDNGNPTKPSFSVTGLAPKKTHKEAIKLLTEARDTLIADKKDKSGKPIKLPKDKFFVKDGDDLGKDGYEDNYAINARESKKPILRGKNKERLGENDDTIYGGCYGSILIRPWYQDNKYGKRVNANLLAVQFTKDGEPFGEGRMGEDDADDYLDGDDDSGFDDGDDDL